MGTSQFFQFVRDKREGILIIMDSSTGFQENSTPNRTQSKPIVQDESPSNVPNTKNRVAKVRDSVLTFQEESKLWLFHIVFVIVLVIITGAFMFFCMVGWTAFDKDGNNYWSNAAIQALVIEFTY